MQSRTSCFNKTVYKKNLTRFAPVWGVYTLGLVLGVVLLYSNGGSYRQFHFANNYCSDLFHLMAMVNLAYGLLVAQLLFGDLFNSRMCNMLHAFPVFRESWFVTNCLSGLTFSVVPTAVMALVAAPLLMGSIFENAAALAFWVFLAANLQFICFFGLAVFAAMCTANRFTMTAGYGLLNGGAMIAYWLIDTVYRPMLYGVITPTTLMWNLTPYYHMDSFSFAAPEFSLWELRDKFGDRLEGAFLSYSLTEHWWRLWAVAAVGIGFLVLALILYRLRNLECAGDAVAFRALVPVFEVLCAVFVATAVQYSLEQMMNMEVSRWVLLASLTVGWFVAKMLVDRSTRVFKVKNCKGLVILAAVFALSLGLTKLDVLGIEDSIPAASKIREVAFETDWTGRRTLDKTSDIEALRQLHAEALEVRAENSGTYILGYDGSWVRITDENDRLYDLEAENPDTRYVAQVGLTYTLNNGKIIKRRYNVWVDSEAGAIANDYLNHWDEINPTYTQNGTEYRELDRVLADFEYFSVNYMDETELPDICQDREEFLDLLEAVKLDIEEGTMGQHPYFHTGCFRREEPRADEGYVETESISVYARSKDYGWHLTVYADARHTLAWLETHDLLSDWQILEHNCVRW